MNDIKINNIPGAPKLVLSANDKLYLATATKSVDKLTFVYTLACLRRGNRYELNPTTEIAAFDNAHDAMIYHKAVQQVMDFQQKMVGPQKIKEILTADISAFNQNVR